ncbi:helix-turn-helix transcriptional regulator [Flavobacterium sp. CYK-4]|uniref:helix-turn-helix domain-containing protein n=1 Tax=Flavobacterium lotistagni TaxID=2709660 RepID=UPI00140C5FBE|nr:helix-turn-helix transcriptional regulator [Flavobacterium lotistagni]NHM06552.1 helix-turn-helix transcriptional regulator [Flavobacterium lotistagni]
MESRRRKNEMPEVVIRLGESIRTIIEEKNLKQRNVAYDAGMDVENLRKYIKGTQEMKVSTLLRIAEALKVPVNELLSF